MMFVYFIIRTIFLAAALYSVSVGAPVAIQYVAIVISSIVWAVTGHFEGIAAGGGDR